MLLKAKLPPLPTFIKCGNATFASGKSHFGRTFHLFDMLFVTKGTIYMKEENQEYEIKAGEYLILAPGLYHKGYKGCEEESAFYWAHFSFPNSYRLEEEGEINWAAIFLKTNTHVTPDIFELCLPRYKRMEHPEQVIALFEKLLAAERSSDLTERMKQQSYFFDILVYLQKSAIELPSRSQEIAHSCMTYIHAHFHRDDFQVRDMAKELLFHPDHLTRAMKKATGLTPLQYLHQVRFRHAKQLLEKGVLDLTTIAIATGFKDVSYFARLFKEKEGMTPGQYRRIPTYEREK
ncbi:AraC family transcriptional regulator [Paenalkalicoccus suaedae]|uniref:AraC family transcriptional regulator n=1 Tax=Paenalkalicoccus suaedae TaxID=2592382 RepID=A0A859FG53_9BACI|nr:AraC family transcriptional regulator [Paenalkalicoccus suaedae]QKS71798.1 AraC family transcriptional regulator [Paenalkalicoccus suaedae]